MNEKQFYQVLDKYKRSTCTKEEKERVEYFFDYHDNKPSVVDAWTDLQRQETSKRLKERVLANIRTERKCDVLNRWMGIAVTVTVLLTLVYIWPNQSTTQKEPVQWITKTAQYGQKLTTQLSDGTVVQLNAGSNISYPEVFSQHERKVLLTGEAFFEVSENSEKPFIVKTGDLITRVVGTSFNIEAYPVEDVIRVTVATGKVQVSKDLNNKSAPILTSGQQAHFDIQKQELSYNHVSLKDFLNWKEGVITFEDTPLLEVLKKLERWYGVKFMYDQRQFGACFISSTYKNESLENVLGSMHFISGLEYEWLNNEQIKITRTQCNQ